MRLTLSCTVIITLVFLSSCDTREASVPQSAPSTERIEAEMRTLSGQIAIVNLPPNRGISADVAFFAVEDENATKPFEGNPPGEAIKDLERLLEDVHLNQESRATTREIPFSVSRSAGHYYIQLRFILYRFEDGNVYAQAEQFFFGKRTLPLLNDITGISLPVEWPSIPLEELGSYGTIEPDNR